MALERRTWITVKPDPGYLDISKLEAAWNAEFTNETPEDAPVLLDFSETTYIDQECLLYIVAVLSERAPWKFETLIELPLRGSEPEEPESPVVESGFEPEDDLPEQLNTEQPTSPAQNHERDRIAEFLHAWQLPRAVKLATGRDISHFLTPASLKRVQAVTSENNSLVKVIDTPYNGREAMLPETYFAITPIRLDKGADEAATLITKEWIEAHIVSVLDLYLKDLGSRVGTYILHEAIVNAARHPEAKVAFTSAQVMYKRYDEKERIPRELVVTIWDNGASFADTLGSGLGRAGVRNAAFWKETDEFSVQFADRDDDRQSRRIELKSGQDALPVEDPDLIVAAFMLGVTSLPERRNRDEESLAKLRQLSGNVLPDGVETYGGLGLHLVRRNVIDLFGGSLQYISGGYRLFLRGDGAVGKYRGFMTKREMLGPQARGNLLVARLPLVERPLLKVEAT